jgi:hypothetical protein
MPLPRTDAESFQFAAKFAVKFVKTVAGECSNVRCFDLGLCWGMVFVRAFKPSVAEC